MSKANRINGTHDLEFPTIKYRHRQIFDIARQIHGRGFIAGGAARALIHPIVPADIDIFCLHTDCEDAIATALYNMEYDEEKLPGKTPCRLFSPRNLPGGYITVQLIRPISGRFGTPMEVMQNFGFFCEQYAYDSRNVMSSFEADRDTKAKELHVNIITNPLDQAWRANKYGKKGFTISRQEITYLFAEWDCLPPHEKSRMIKQQMYSVDNSDQAL